MGVNLRSDRVRSLLNRALLIFSVAIFQSSALAAIALFTAPNGLDSVEGDTASPLPFGNSAECANGFRYQQIINGDQGIFGTVGAIAFRLDGSADLVGPLTYGNTTITLSSTSRTSSTMSPDFDANVGLDRKVVYRGDLEIIATTNATGTNPFDIVVVDGGGFRFGDEGDNLLIDITVTDCPPAAAFFMDAVASTNDVRGLFSGDRESASGSLGPGLVAELVASSPPPVPPLYDCPFNNTPGDVVSRGFVLENFPDNRLGRVTLNYTGTATGTYAVELIARQGQFDGAIVGAETRVFDVSDTATQYPVTFDFHNAPVGQGTDITFTHRIRSQPTSSSLSYDVGSSACPDVFQTNGTTPPLDSVRRDRVGILVTVSDPDVRLRGLGGNWTVADRAAEGFMIDVTDEDQLVAIWFTYDSDGTQQWLIGSTGSFPDNDIGLDLFKADGPTFAQIRQDGFDNNLIDLEPWGRMYVRFLDCDRATVTYASDSGFGSGEFEIIRVYETEENSCVDPRPSMLP
jgi:hypothetical protein